VFHPNEYLACHDSLGKRCEHLSNAGPYRLTEWLVAGKPLRERLAGNLKRCRDMECIKARKPA
jgi:hypothetical protein